MTTLLIVLGVAVPLALQAQARSVDWPLYGGTTDNTRYSTLAQITPANVGQLKVAWTYDDPQVACDRPRRRDWPRDLDVRP
jgi:glucose dehydrogenase